MGRESIELEPLFLLQSPYEKARHFFTLLFKEVGISHSFLTEEERKLFAWYYGNLEPRDVARRNHFCHRHSQRVQHLVNVATDGQKILDASCGLGSEAILCGTLGAHVIGVDPLEQYVNVAKKRLKIYEQALGRRISTEFNAQSVFDVQDSFDVIWSLESISHIDPADRFVAYAYEHLNEGGKLIISDPNKLNPLIYWNTRKASRRQGSPVIYVHNPHTGEMITWAVERVFDVFSIKKLLLRHGFVIESCHYSGLLPYLPGLNIMQSNISLYLEKLMNPIWPKWISGIYTVVATRS